MAIKKKAGKAWRFAGKPVDPVALPSSVENAFSDRFLYERDLISHDPDSLLHVTSATMRTWESAARASLGLLHEPFGDKYSVEEIAAAVSTAASLPVSVTERCAKSPVFLLGAALWLLDYFEESDRRDRFQSLLPERPESGIIFRVPLLDDLIHSPDDILRLMTVLCSRDGTGRNAFSGILRLIDKEAAAALRAAFKDCLLDYFSRYMEVCTRVKRSSPDDTFPSVPDFPALPCVDPFRIDSGLDSLEISRAKSSPDVTFLLLTPGLVGASDAELRNQLYFRRSVNLLRGFTMDDPHMICAAYLLLEEEGDALASLNTLTSAVITCAEQMLPWGIDKVRAFPKTFGDGSPDYELRYTFSAPDEESAEDLPDIPAEKGQKLSEAQLFYFATGYALPRRTVPSQKLIDWFIRQGLPKQRSREFAFGAMLAFYLDNLRERASLMFPTDSADEEEDVETEGRLEESPQPGETQYEQQIADLTRQVKNLRGALYESERMTKQLQEQLLETEQRSAQEHTELSRLREVLYQMRSGGEQEAPGAEPAIELPCQVARRVLIFGGHETWLKAIRPLLPGARFSEPELLPDLGALRGADVIWIQANAISHKFFYRIINAARKWSIPVRYFGYASARKCAEQLAADELTDGEA